MPEREVEKYLVEQVKNFGGEARKLKWDGRRGAPDRVVMLHGLTIWVELKAPGCKPASHQKREHKRMRNMRQRVEVIDSLEAIDLLLSDPQILKASHA